MDWNAAIENNREALKRVLAMLVAMAGLDDRPTTLPRHLHRAVLGLLRPAEAAVRRLIVVAARGIVVALPPARPRKLRPTFTILRNGIGTGIVMPRGFRPGAGTPAARTLALPLVDPLPRWGASPRPGPSGVPRISIPGLTQPFPVPRAPSPDDPIDVARLALRLGDVHLVLVEQEAELPIPGERRQHQIGAEQADQDGERELEKPDRGVVPAARRRPAALDDPLALGELRHGRF